MDALPDAAPDPGPAGAEAGDGAAAVRQYVTFHLDADCYAFPMERVLEIIRMPRIVGVPLAPPDMLGLANLRGAILPVRDLRTALALPARTADDLSRTIVIDAGEPVGLVVDRVARVIGLADDRIEAPDSTDALGEAVRRNILRGVAKEADGAALIQILDPVAAIAAETPDAAAQRAAPTLAAAASADSDPAGAATGRQIVCIELDGQEYAFDIAEVAEIVRPPEAIFRVPMTASHVLGVIDLRARLLPILGLRRILGLTDLPVTEANRIVVLRLDGQDGTQAVGVVVDHVREVLEVPAEALVVTAGLVREDGIASIGTMCRLEGGRRLVGMLSAATLLGRAGVRAAIRASLDAAADATPAVTGEGEDGMTDNTGETQVVVFQLGGQEYGVGIAHVLEIIRVPERLTRVPRSPGCVAGVINLRGAVLPVIALREVFGIGGAQATERARIVVLSIGGAAIGYIVDAVTEVLRLPCSALEPAARPGGVGAGTGLIGRVARLEGGERLVQIVETDALPGADAAAADATEPAA